MPSCSGSSQPRDWTWVSWVSCIAGRFFTDWVTEEAPILLQIVVCTCQSQFILLPHHFPPGNYYKFAFYISDSTSVLKISSFVLFLDVTYKWYHIFVFLPLTYFTPSRFIHVTTNGVILFFLWQSNIPLYIFTTSSLSIHLQMKIYVTSNPGYCK